MHATLDAAVQFIQVGLLFVLIAQNFSVGKRLKALEEKLNR